ncbi:MAG TPA: DHA2 family efflux MFS transporter permease subunit [Polyangiaceae bacterium]|nr:DHA2 family efflux MFS transporter permease subunit [Polyangiaceae bacterium]
MADPLPDSLATQQLPEALKQASTTPPPPLVLSPQVKRLVPWLVAVAFFMEALDTTILNTAVPRIADALHVAPLSMKSALTSYTLSLAVFIPVSGWVADRFGTRRVFSTAIGLFTLGSFLCGVSNDLHLLVACRVLQGMGGALMVPVGRLTVVRTFPKAELVRAMSFVAIPSLIGPMLGPLAGGVIVSYLNWRTIFFVNLPMGAAGVYLVRRYLPDYTSPKVGKLDVTGMVLFGCGIALLSYVLEVFGEHRLSTREILGLLVLSVVLLVGYWHHSRLRKRPLLRLSLFGVRTFRAAVIGGFITRLGAGGMPFLLPLLYQVGLGHTPIESGLLIMPQSVAAMSLKMTMPKILTRFGYRRVLLSNTLIIGLIIALFATVDGRTSVSVIVAQAFAFGFFSSLQFTSMNTLVFSDVADVETSSASTIASTLQQMSMSFGVATASLAAALFIPDRFSATSAQMLHGIHEALLVLGVLTALSTVVFAGLRATDGENVSQHHERRDELD